MPYTHDRNDVNINNLHHAMELVDEIPHVRVTLGSDNITVTGSVNVASEIKINNTDLQSIPVHLTDDPIGVTGTFWQTTQPVSLTTLPDSSVSIKAGSNLIGKIDVNNWPATQPVSIASMPTTPVTGTFWQTTQPVSGTVTANVTFPTTQQVSGTVTLDSSSLTALENINATVSGTVELGSTTLTALENVGVTGTVTVQDGGGSITVDGTVSATVSGTVELGTSTLSALENTTVTISGTPTVNIGTIPEVEIKNDTGNPIPISGTVNANVAGIVTTTVVDGQQDAFGRLRVSEAFTLGDYKHTYGIDPNFRDTLTNGGTVTHIANQACARLETTSNTNSRAIHQTKMYHNYMPGKSQLIKTTINFYSATTNVTKRTGYFDDLNGIYFEQNGLGVLSFVIRTNTSGTASDARRITQANWNKDKCDGTGSSSFNLDITKTQIVFIDFQWLGVGRVRCGFVHNGQMIIAHEFYNSNNLPVVYMANPNLPIRCEILNTGTTAGGYFDQICSTVISEGGYIESGIDFSADSGQTSQSITVANGMYPIMAIRLKNSFRSYPNRVVVRSGNINIYAEDFPAYWALYKLSDLSAITLSSSTWTSANDDSSVEYSLNATAFTGGDRIDGGIVGATSPGGSAKGTGTAPVNQPSNAKKNFIAQNLDSTDSEIYLVCSKAIGGTTKIWVDFQWREIY